MTFVVTSLPNCFNSETIWPYTVYLQLVPREKGTARNYNKVRELATVFIVHYEFVPTGQTVNQVLLFGSTEKAA